MGGGPDDGAGAIEMGEFDWNSVKDDDVELWLVRVPNLVCLLLGLFLFSAGLDAARPRLALILRVPNG